MDAITQVPTPTNEPILDFEPGSAARAGLELALKEQASVHVELTATIGGEQRPAGGA